MRSRSVVSPAWTALVFAGTVLVGPSAHAQGGAGWSIEVLTGAAHNFALDLTVRQSGLEELSLTGRFETRPFEDAPYYAVRLARWGDRSGWELELLHHKLYLSEPTPEVERFDVSHGFNVVSLIRTWRVGGWAIRTGGGIVVAHPETVVRGRASPGTGGLFGRGYFVTGPAAQLGAGRRLRLGGGLFLGAEGAFTAARAHVPVVDGEASVPNVAVHVRVGLGWSRE